jgi:hypothetical protein
MWLQAQFSRIPVPFSKGSNLLLVRDHYTRATQGNDRADARSIKSNPSDGDAPMTQNAMTETQDDMLTFDISDDVLEIAASAPSGQVYFTLAACTGLSSCPA